MDSIASDLSRLGVPFVGLNVLLQQLGLPIPAVPTMMLAGALAMTGRIDLLAAFAENPNRVLSRDRLLDLAHNRDWEPFDRSIDIRIARIRRKVEPDPTKPQVIKTVRGAGYIYVPPKP